ncbi:hypothetical protein ACIQJX_26290 [Streptomyces griseoviridis]|uniref:hypothetical protein n=1 Tax=Streptomyces griseoviridis TaxID=45398 RepID=UPI0034217E23
MTTNTVSQSRSANRTPSALDNLRPLLLDVAVPLGSYYLFKNAFGASRPRSPSPDTSRKVTSE